MCVVVVDAIGLLLFLPSSSPSSLVANHVVVAAIVLLLPPPSSSLLLVAVVVVAVVAFFGHSCCCVVVGGGGRPQRVAYNVLISQYCGGFDLITTTGTTKFWTSVLRGRSSSVSDLATCVLAVWRARRTRS